MVRKLAAVFLLSFLVIAFVSVSLGAEKLQKPRSNLTSLRARAFNVATDSYQGQGAPASPPQQMLLKSGSRANPEDIGATYYDYQHNCTMGRQVEHRAGYVGNPTGTYIHMDWMDLAAVGQQRGVGYQAYNLDPDSCKYVFPNPGGLRIEGNNAGYVDMDANDLDALNSWAVPAAHQYDTGAIYAPTVYWDVTTQGPVFGLFVGDFPSDKYGYYENAGIGRPDTNYNIWPKHEWDIDGAEQVLHMVTTEASVGTDPQTMSYYRRVGPYGAGLGVWSDQHVIDTVTNINVTVASSPISDKVAIVWLAVADYRRGSPDEYTADYSQINNDVWFAIATDNGASWASHSTKLGNPSIGHSVDLGLFMGYNPSVGGNLTTYDSMGTFRGYCDLSALWSIKDDPDDYLQIVWMGHYWNTEDSADLWAYRNRAAIYHWNQKFDEIVPVIKAGWIDTVTTPCLPYAWGGNVAKMTISECDGKFYICYSQFGLSDTDQCGAYDGTANAAGWNMMVGQLYMTVYDETYHGWDRPQTVTGPVHASGPCTAGSGGDCNSEYWSSMARYGRVDNCKLASSGPAVDIVYINDITPGGCVQTNSGVWSLNPVKWMVYPCRDAVPEPGFKVTPVQIGLCYNQAVVALGTTDDTTLTLLMENNGIIPNDPVSLVAQYTGGGSGNTNVTITPNSGISIPVDGEVSVSVDITTSGEDEFVIVYYNIIITQQAGENPPNDVTVPMCILVSDYYQSIESAVLATACKRLRVYNNGELSNNATNASLDFTTDPDNCANIYLYDGSPLICRDDAGTKVCYHSAFDNYYGTPATMRALTPLFVDSTTYPDYTYATAEFLTGDSTIGLIAEYYAPASDNVENCGYVIEKLKFWNRSEVTLFGVAAGEVLDWDVESHEHGSENFPGQDAAHNLVYQTCNGDNQHDPCDTLQTCQRFAGIAAATGVGTDQDSLGFKNYLVLENDVFVYETGDYALPNNPLSPDSTYGIMTARDGYWWKNYPNNPVDTGEDLNTVVTFGVYDMDPNDTICVVKILTTSKDDPNAVQLKANVDLANAFIEAHAAIKCAAGGCCITPGDANGDVGVNVGDAVYLITYIFKDGPPPPCLDEGDANGDCGINVGDAVYLITYIFKDGPPPVCGCVTNPPK